MYSITISGTVLARYIVVIFLLKKSWKIPHRSPMRACYGVLFASAKPDQSVTIVSVALCPLTCYIWPNIYRESIVLFVWLSVVLQLKVKFLGSSSQLNMLGIQCLLSRICMSGDTRLRDFVIGLSLGILNWSYCHRNTFHQAYKPH